MYWLCIHTFRILIMGTIERLGVNIHVDQLMDTIANNCTQLERIELRWDPLNLRFSDKSQKAIDIVRVKCFKLKSLVLRYVRWVGRCDAVGSNPVEFFFFFPLYRSIIF